MVVTENVILFCSVKWEVSVIKLPLFDVHVTVHHDKFDVHVTVHHDKFDFHVTVHHDKFDVHVTSAS
jgi:hypothetical protein